MNKPNQTQTWIWFLVMLAATAWYAWPQLFFSLFVVYDAIVTYSPATLDLIRPLLDYLNQLRENSLWWNKY